GGSLRLAELFETAAKRMGVDTVRSADPIDISVIYDAGNYTLESSQEAPLVRLYREGWEERSRRAIDTLENISADALEEVGRALSLSLMILGRETDY
ncbi:MAG: hypothetical protein KAS38_18335, partial [Anaerolineales bacterium]|nr:hypothetical protein [Anaerolineales bacterium]